MQTLLALVHKLERIETKRLFIYSCIVSLALLTLGLAAEHLTSAYDTDDVGLQTALMNAELGDGLYTKMRQNSYVFKAPWALLMNVLPQTRLVIFFTVWAMWAAAVPLIFFSFYYFTKLLKLEKQKLLIAAVLTAFFAITPITKYLINFNYRNLEVGLAFVVILGFWLYLEGKLKLDSWLKKSLVPVAALLLGFFLYSDPFWVYMLVLPLVLMSLYLSMKRRTRRFAMHGLLFLASAYLIHLALSPLLLQHFEFYLASKGPGIIPPDQLVISERIKVLMETSHHLFKTTIYRDLAYSETGILALFLKLNYLLTLLMLTAPVVAIVQLWQARQKNPWFWFFPLSMLMVFGIMFTASAVVGAGSTRYMITLPFLLAITLGICAAQAQRRWLTYGLLAILSVIITINTLGHIQVAATRQVAPNQEDAETIAAIAERGLTKGYANSGGAAILTWLSGNTIKVTPVVCQGGKRIGLFPRQFDESMLIRKASKTFYVLDKKDVGGRDCSAAEVYTSFGQAQEEVVINNDITIYFYDRDLRYDVGGR